MYKSAPAPGASQEVGRMLLRNRVYAPYTVIAAFDGLTDATLDGLPAAIVRYVLSPAGRPMREHPTLDDREAERLLAALRSVTEHLPPGASLQDLVVRARAILGSVPFAMVRSGNAVAIRVPHALMDGRGANEFYRFVIDTAAGGTGRLDARPAPRRPYLRMLASGLRPASVRAYLAEQAGVVEGPVAHRPSADDLALRTARFETFVLDRSEVERFLALDRRGSSSSARLGSLAIRALRRVHRGGPDLPVQIPVDLRRWAPAGRIDGNFISVAPLGGLLTDDWSPAALGGRIRAAMKARTPIVRSLHTMLYQVTRYPKRRVKRLLREPVGPGRLGISVSMLVDPEDYVDAAWLPGVPRRVGAATIGAWPSSTFVSIVQSAGRTRLTVWDEAGAFDLDRFREALDEELAGKVAVGV